MSDIMISEILHRSAEVKNKMISVCAGPAEQAAQMIATSMREGGKLMLCGNGGSAGDSQHLAAEFVATLDHTKPRPSLPALSLTTDTSFLTAYANDFGFEGVFARQVEVLGQPGDVLLGISTSGNSKNVLAAAKAAKDNQISVIAFTGETGGQMAEFAGLLVAILSRIIMHIQECHIALGHAITARVETFFLKNDEMFGRDFEFESEA